MGADPRMYECWPLIVAASRTLEVWRGAYAVAGNGEWTAALIGPFGRCWYDYMHWRRTAAAGEWISAYECNEVGDEQGFLSHKHRFDQLITQIKGHEV